MRIKFDLCCEGEECELYPLYVAMILWCFFPVF